MDPTNCSIDGQRFDEEGFCPNGHQKPIHQEEQKMITDDTHCSIDGSPFDEDGFCAYKHKRP